jgi:predicted AlkP superfamily pyrophosphatase or phosphodiesterase
MTFLQVQRDLRSRLPLIRSNGGERRGEALPREPFAGRKLNPPVVVKESGRARFLSGVLAFLMAGMIAFTAQATARVGHVFIISIDGGKPAVIAKSEMPTLQKMVAEGAHTWQATTIVPPKTLPAHTSMLTGVGPGKHHILWNEYEPKKGLVQVPTVFSLAKQAGFSTAIFTGKEKFRHLDLPGTVDEFDFNVALAGTIKKRMAGSFFSVEEKTVRAQIVASDAAPYIIGQKPALCFIHLTDPDDFGHEFGWGSPQQMKAFADTDVALDIILQAIRTAGIADDTVIIVTADHGGHKKTHGLNIPDDMIIPWVVWGKGVKKNLELTAPVNTCDTTATALWLLDVPLPAALDGKPVTSAFE